MAEVDVLLPVREPAPWLTEALTGLVAQDDIDWHLVVVVHGADRTTSSTVAQWQLPATVCHVPDSGSLPHVLDVGLSACRSPYVARLDSDDVPLPGRLSGTLRLLNDNPGLLVAASQAQLIDASGLATGLSPRISSEADLVRRLRWRNVIVHSSVTFRREAIERLGGYAVEAQHAEDYELWLRVLAMGRVGMVSKVLVQHRVHPDQVSQRRAIPIDTSRAVGRSRLALARARGESVLAARGRQAVWASRQAARRLRRG